VVVLDDIAALGLAVADAVEDDAVDPEDVFINGGFKLLANI
jgi:hypothetical protein